MSFLGRLAEWFADPANWTGDRGIPALVAEHLWVSVVATVLGALLAIAPAVWLAHRRRGRFVANALVNVGRAVPSFGVIVIAAVLFIRAGLSARFWPLVIALLLLALPPMFTNAYTAVAEVDPAIVEAARGMGYTDGEVLRRVELPLATPVLLTGVRIAFVQVIATATLGAVVSSGGGLGQPIVFGFSTFRSGGDVPLVGGAILVALLTLFAERLVTTLERRVLPVGVRRLQDAGQPAADAAPEVLPSS